MQLRLVIERAAHVPLHAVGDCPVDDVAQRVEVEIEIKRHRVVEAEVFVVDRVAVDHADAEGDRLSRLPPDEETRLVRHAFAEGVEEFFGQLLEVERRALVDGEVERIDLVDERRDVRHDLQFDRHLGPLRRAKLSAQALPRRLAQLLRQKIIKIIVHNIQPGHGHARHAREAVTP